ncbi:hypothetical protein [Candidatus Dormiibacter inghamiae]
MVNNAMQQHTSQPTFHHNSSFVSQLLFSAAAVFITRAERA